MTEPSPAAATDVVRHVTSRLTFEVYENPRAILQLAVSRFAADQVSESLVVSSAGRTIDVTELRSEDASRLHTFVPGTGRLTIEYTASVSGRTALAPVTPLDRITYLRPSRYAESDRLGGMAEAEFAGIASVHDKIAAVSSWTGTHLEYVPGSSGPMDGAVDTMVQRQGVCRDYAHLVIALLRALDVPARLAAVYAPGLDPMDFHAVAEAVVGDRWVAVDATLLAPRAAMLPIATGRDAADTAFASIYGGAADLLEAEVTAVIDGALPLDDLNEDVSIC